VQAVLGTLSAEAQEVLSATSVIQAFVKEPVESARFAGHAQRYLETYKGLINDRVQMTLLMGSVASVSTLVVLLLGGWQVMQGVMNLGGFVAFSLYLKRLGWPTMAFGWAMTIFQQAAASLERIDAVLTADPHAVVSSRRLHCRSCLVEGPSPVAEGLWIRQLSFAYHNPYPFAVSESAEVGAPKATGWGLVDVSLHIPEGQLVAVVGAIGSGKSTLLRLIPRIWEPSAGTVFWQGQDIATMPLAALRQHIGYMSQLGFLFSVSVAENIRFGKPQALQPEVAHWAQMADIHDEILGLPQGYDTLVGERGVLLSGGQRQRLALARTLLIEPTLLLLDDPFSSVDVDTEQAILNALCERQVLKGRTTLIATHRFSVVQQADMVVLMDAGRVVATGQHRTLLAEQPLYQRLYHEASQSSSPAAGDDAEWSTQLAQYLQQRQARLLAAKASRGAS
jgi:ATP-binding cassette subfamily B multidrug efflux pump